MTEHPSAARLAEIRADLTRHDTPPPIGESRATSLRQEQLWGSIRDLSRKIDVLTLERDAATEFFWRCWDGAHGLISEPDGSDIQDWAYELGLLQKVVRDKPCSENCVCEEYGADFPTDCYEPVRPRNPAATAPEEQP